MSTNKSLIIIGNGFDLAHGLETSYPAFYNRLSDEIKIKWENSYLPAAELIDNWYEFEVNILKLTQIWFESYFDKASSGQNTIDEERQIKVIDDAFNSIKRSFQIYLGNENRKSVPLNEKIKEYISPNSQVVTFNYTDLIKKYTGNVIYIHGSLNEQSIIFGYNLQGEHDFTPALATTFSKSRLRDLNEYRIFLIQKGFNSSEIEKEIEIFRNINNHSYTGKGGFGFEYGEIENDIRNEYMKYHFEEGKLITSEEYFLLT